MPNFNQGRRGICVSCEEKYIVGHKVKTKKLRTMVVLVNGEESKFIEEGGIREGEGTLTQEVMSMGGIAKINWDGCDISSGGSIE